MIQNTTFRILSCFFHADTLSFTKICDQAGYPTDLGGYYIRQLVGSDYLVKLERGLYGITARGKQQLVASYEKHMFVQRPRLNTLIIATQNGKYIVSRRNRQPFIGVAEWPAGAIRFGEKLSMGAARIAHERFGFDCQPEPAGFFRRIDMYGDTVFDDKLFAVHTCDIPKDTTVSSSSTTGQNIVVTRAELEKLPKPSQALLDIFLFAQTKGTYDEERTYRLEPRDVSLPEM